jgi:hypothetical protein
MMVKKIKGTKVFMALRPNIYGLPREHVTLEYLGDNPTGDQVKLAAYDWNKQFAGLPVTVRVNGYANWLAKDEYHHVALINFHEYPELSYVKNWHITLESSRQPIEPRMFDKDVDAFNYDIADRLWLGYTDEHGVKKFIETHNAHHLIKDM